MVVVVTQVGWGGCTGEFVESQSLDDREALLAQRDKQQVFVRSPRTRNQLRE